MQPEDKFTVQYTGSGTAAESNKQLHYLLQQGITALNILFDLPTRQGYDSDHAMVTGAVGKDGVAIDSIEDMEALFEGIRLPDVCVSITTSATGFILLAFYIAIAKRQNADLRNLKGTLQNDISLEHAINGSHIYPVKPSIRINKDVFEWCAVEVPMWRPMSVSDYPTRENMTKSADLNIDDAIRQVQIDKLASLRRRRNPAKCDSILQGLNDCAAGDENIMPAVLEAAENNCTLGEIADTLREVYGEYKEVGG